MRTLKGANWIVMNSNYFSVTPVFKYLDCFICFIMFKKLKCKVLFDTAGRSLQVNYLRSFNFIPKLFHKDPYAQQSKLIHSLSSLFYYTSIIKFIDWNLFSSFDSMDIMLRAFWRSGNFKNTRRWIRGRVLLTGSTGFLGGFLLRDLIRLTKVITTFKNVIWYLLYFLQMNAWSFILKFRFYGQCVK